MATITDRRRSELRNFAHLIASEFSDESITSLESIAESEELSTYFDHYENTFDGMLVYDEGSREFHIHINKDKGNHLNSKRGRFTYAHELAHYFIDEHRMGLKKGILNPHFSTHSISSSDLIEIEANYFASCLLMPEEKFRTACSGHKFSIDLLLLLSEKFQSSVLATALKFVEIGTHEITIVISENNKVKWFSQSKDFPKWPFRFKVGQELPATTVAGEFFTKPNSKYTSVEELSADDWFYVKDSRGNRTMYEQCYYSESYKYVISAIWFK